MYEDKVIERATYNVHNNFINPIMKKQVACYSEK